MTTTAKDLRALLPKQIGKEKCWCGHKVCNDWWLTGIGKFEPGSGFTEDEADALIAVVNQWHRITDALDKLEAMEARDAE